MFAVKYVWVADNCRGSNTGKRGMECSGMAIATRYARASQVSGSVEKGLWERSPHWDQDQSVYQAGMQPFHWAPQTTLGGIETSAMSE